MILNFKRQGSGEPVILIHGLLGNLDNLGRLARHLSESYEVFSIDLPNHGLSSHTQLTSYPFLSEAILSLLVNENLKDVHLVGHSMGGKVAMQLAIDNPTRVKTLSVADIAPVTYTDRHTNIFAALNAINLSTLVNRKEAIDVVTSHGIDSGTAQFLLKNLAKNDDGFFWRCNIENLQQGYKDIISGLTGENTYGGPTLFIKGGKSDYIQAEHRPTIMKHFPQAIAKIIEGTGHWLHAEKPASFNKIIDDFITKNSDEITP